jgi:hypothetical protein
MVELTSVTIPYAPPGSLGIDAKFNAERQCLHLEGFHV